MNWLNKFFSKNSSKVSWQQRQVEQYLSESIDLADVERRQKEIERGLAPWQIKQNLNLSVWA